MIPSDEQIERVARALHSLEYPNATGENPWGWDGSECHDLQRAEYRQYAITAIEAMGESS